MSRRNVTLALDEGVLKEARHLAVEHGLSLSALLARTLEERICSETSYRRAMDRQIRLMSKGLPLGLSRRGRISRDDLHERR